MAERGAARERLSAFEGRWLAETLRVHEAGQGALADEAAVIQARQQPADFEQRLIARAQALPVSGPWLARMRSWQSNARLLLLLALLLAVGAGWSAAAAVLGDAQRAVNVVWALGVLLGVNTLMLLLWLLSLLAAPRLDGAPGRRWRGWAGWLLGRWLRRQRRRPQAAALATALPALLERSSAPRWALATFSHLLWTASLLGAALGLLLLFALRRYGFVWETTILPADSFIALTEGLGRLPALLGIPVPSRELIVLSGNEAVFDEGGRRLWAAWLGGVLLSWGLLPRLLLALCCGWRWRRALAGLRLDLERPAYEALRPRLLPDSELLGVSDPAPARAAPAQRATVEVTGGAALLLALELDPAWPWPPQGEGLSALLAAVDGGRVDSGAERRALLSRLAAAPPQRVVVALALARLPERGLLAFISELIGLSGELRLWLLVDEAMAAAQREHRLQQWQRALLGLGLSADDYYLAVEPAAAWLARAGGEVR